MAKIVLTITGSVDEKLQTAISGLESKLASLQKSGSAVNVGGSGVQQATKDMNALAGATQRISEGFSLVKQSFTETNGQLTQLSETYKNTLGDTLTRVETVKGKVTDTLTQMANDPAMTKIANVWGTSVADMQKATAEYDKMQAAVTPVNTKLQGTIDSITGVDRVTKSAAQSASVFEREMSNLDAKVMKTTASTEQNAVVTKKQADLAELAARRNTLLGDSLDRIVAKMTAWMLLGNVIAGVVRSFKEALKTMKDVDQQLINIQKVSDLTAKDIERIGNTAYETASKYGVAANEYLEAVYTFQKAGLGDSAEAMGELATKTMLVGDTTAEVATRFLISANAAWKFGGDIKELSRLVDEADYINNNYAATLSDIATGLPIVGAAAAQAGMTTEQTMSAIATIVASTGQTASKSATALRAIIMNLIKDTGTLEDGTEITAESIDSLNAVLNKYAPEALAAAEATGKIVDPMEAIAALAKAAEDPLVTESALFGILSDLGGKLRTTQLTALVNNTEMYNKMLAGTAEAAGTADREIGIMLESWNAKTQILKNTWAEFLSGIISTDGVKGALDVVTGLIKVLDSEFGHLVITIGLATVAFSYLTKGIVALAGSKTILFIAYELKLLTLGMEGAKLAAQNLWAVLSKSPLFWLLTASAAIYGLTKAVDALIVTQEEQAEKAAKARQEYEQAQAELDKVNEKIAENKRLLNEANAAGKNNAYVARLERENTLLEAQKNHLQDIADIKGAEAAKEAMKGLLGNSNYYIESEYGSGVFDTKAEGWDNANAMAYYTPGVDIMRWTDTQAADNLLNLAEAGYDTSEALTEIIGRLIDYRQVLRESQPDEKEQIDIIGGILERYNGFKETVRGVTDELDEASEPVKSLTEQLEAQAAALEALNGEIDKVQSSLQSLTAAQEEYNEYGDISVDTLQNLLSLDAEYLDALIDENGQINLNSDSVATLIAGKNVLLERLAAESIATYAVQHAQELLTEQEGKAADATDTMSSKLSSAAEAALKTGLGITAATGAIDQFLSVAAGEGYNAGLRGQSLIQWLDDVKAYANNVGDVLSGVNLGLEGWTRTDENNSDKGSGKDETTKEKTRLEIIKERIKLLESELSLAQERGDSEEQQIDLMRQIQDALHDEAEELRNSAEYQEAIKQQQEDASQLTTEQVELLTQVSALSEEWWKYQNKINEAYEKTLEALKDAEDAEYQKLIDAAEAQKDIADENLDIEEKKLAVLKAQADLINAQNERTIRYWNAQTGQWELAANQQDVQAARDALTSARGELQGAIQQKYINSLQRAQTASNAAWDSVLTLSPEMQQAVMGGMNNNGLSVGQAYGIVTGNPADSACSMISTSGNSYQGNFGTVYQFGTLQISEAQAKNLTVGELATLLGMNLPINNSTY